jgi:hypothetical protein
MLDQSFTANNFYNIFLYENRKGNNIEKKFFENDIYIKHTHKIREINSKLRTSREIFIKNDIKNRIPSKESFIRYKKYLRVLKRKLKEEKETDLLIILERISNNIQNKNFSFSLTTGMFDGKTVYKIGNSPEEFFAIKQLQYNFKKLYKIKQSNRFEIVNQLNNLLSDNFPKYIIKTDIKSFYESIPNDIVISKLQQDNLLSPKSKDLVVKIIKKFKNIANIADAKGIPRGIGISAYLAEYYMRKVDDKIKNTPDIIYYARYVDDIIIIFSPKSTNQFPDYFSKIEDIIEKDFSLVVNKKKTQIIIQSKNNIESKVYKKINGKYKITNLSSNEIKINYLGYSYLLNSKLEITITDNKVKRYKEKIKLSFNEYLKYKNKRKAYQHLRDRLKFLTKNYRLHNNKGHILTGLYFSNMLVTKLDFLDELDKYLKWYLSRYVKNAYHKNKLSEFSFKSGFEKIEYTKLSNNQIKSIIRIWKNV